MRNFLVLCLTALSIPMFMAAARGQTAPTQSLPQNPVPLLPQNPFAPGLRPQIVLPSGGQLAPNSPVKVCRPTDGPTTESVTINLSANNQTIELTNSMPLRVTIPAGQACADSQPFDWTRFGNTSNLRISGVVQGSDIMSFPSLATVISNSNPVEMNTNDLEVRIKNISGEIPPADKTGYYELAASLCVKAPKPLKDCDARTTTQTVTIKLVVNGGQEELTITVPRGESGASVKLRSSVFSKPIKVKIQNVAPSGLSAAFESGANPESFQFEQFVREVRVIPTGKPFFIGVPVRLELFAATDEPRVPLTKALPVYLESKGVDGKFFQEDKTTVLVDNKAVILADRLSTVVYFTPSSVGTLRITDMANNSLKQKFVIADSIEVKKLDDGNLLWAFVGGGVAGFVIALIRALKPQSWWMFLVRPALGALGGGLLILTYRYGALPIAANFGWSQGDILLALQEPLRVGAFGVVTGLFAERVIGAFSD
jgi:hypothetical protein